MCGIFGFVGSKTDISIIELIGVEAAKRGPQAWGVAWPQENEMHVYKQEKKFDAKEMQKLKKILTDNAVSAMVGNCRLSTSGTFENENNNQPMVLSNITISHNGNVHEYQHIAEEYNVKLNTECDSEIICHMVNVVGIENTISQLSNTGPIALLILQGNKMTAFRKGQPLYVLERDGCFYFCSRKFLNARSLEEGQILTFGG